MADEEPVDRMPIILEENKAKCDSYLKLYEACAERVRAKGEGHCTGQYFDFWHCVDDKSASAIFAALK